MLALPGGVAVAQRGQDADQRVLARHHVEDRDAGAEGRAVGGAGEAHQPGHRLDHEVVARHVPAAGGPEARDRGVDQPRVVGRDGLVVQPVLGHAARAQVLDEDVGAARELLAHRDVLGVAQVERDRALPAVDAEVVGRRLVALRRRPGARLVALRRLDLDHLGTQVRQQHRRVGPGQHPREVGHHQPGQRPAAGPLGVVLRRHPHASVRQPDTCPSMRSLLAVGEIVKAAGRAGPAGPPPRPPRRRPPRDPARAGRAARDRPRGRAARRPAPRCPRAAPTRRRRRW